MSISSALSNAYSGVSANSKKAEVISNNVSNALTEGYNRQTVQNSANVLGGFGGGVRTEGVTRSENLVITAARMGADANFAMHATIEATTSRLARMLGEPGESGVIATQISEFANALTTAASSPDSVAYQQEVFSAAKSISMSLNKMSNEVSLVRSEADAVISNQIEIVNGSLRNIEELNSDIRSAVIGRRNTASLKQQRQDQIDIVNKIVPIRTTASDFDEISVYSIGGAILLNGSARALDFTQTSMITPGMSLAAGSISGVSINGKPVILGLDGGQLKGGSLAPNFQTRDLLGPELQTKLDALTSDLIVRFQDVAVDHTLVAGDAGLFTDSGASFNLTNSEGISARIAINPQIDPENGGEHWRIRDGLGAATPGAVGDNTLLVRMSNAINRSLPPLAGFGFSKPNSSAGFAEEISALMAVLADATAGRQASALARLTDLASEESGAVGVDTDQEMQELLLVEQAFSANARVISVLDELMQRILEI